MMVTLYGLANCDTCRKAKKVLESNGFGVTFHDVRAEALPKAKLEIFHAEFGESLLNTRSTTWRGLSETQRADDPIALLIAHPALMKRPLIERNGTLTLGWSGDVQAVYLGNAGRDD